MLCWFENFTKHYLIDCTNVNEHFTMKVKVLSWCMLIAEVFMHIKNSFFKDVDSQISAFNSR